MVNMLNNVGMDCINYDATLIGWQAQGVTGLSLGATGLTYDISSSARTALTTTLGWTISGDTQIPGCNTVALPIELVNFSASLEGDIVYLAWTTASEINNDYFTVQRSKDGINWENLMDVNGAGNSTTVLYYRAADTQPIIGTSYYRLIQYDVDGAFSESPIVALQYDVLDAFYVYPNPSNGIVTIASAGSEEKFNFKIMNLNGKVIGATTTAINGSESAIAHLEGYQSGVYLIRIFNKTTEKTFRIIKK
jgi:hypothetical protein